MKLNMWHAPTQNQSQSKAIREIFSEFCRNSTIHGIRYFTERRRHWSERFWWVVAFGLSICCCFFSIWHILIKWNENPVQMCFTEKPSPISKIPFPTVTICPETKAHISKFNVTDAYNSVKGLGPGRPEPGGPMPGGPELGRPGPEPMLSGLKGDRMDALSHICQFHFPPFLHWGKNFTNESIYSILTDIAPSLNYSMFQCSWLNNEMPCSALFTPVLTESGLCFSFNAPNAHEVFTPEIVPEFLMINNKPNVTNWSLETGYAHQARGKAYPIRVFSAKQTSALVVFLRLFDNDLEYVCQSLVPGFKIYLHTPGEVPAMSRKSFRVPIMEEAELAITPTLITTEASLKNYKPWKRQCFFTDERKLRFYQIYAQTNCEAECLSNFTKMECGCVQFSMPKDNKTRICGAAKIRCYQMAEKRLFGEDVMDGLQDDIVKSFRAECNCLPACTSISYDAEIDRARLDWNAVMKTYGQKTFRHPGMLPSLVTIYFRVYQVETHKRTEVNTLANFLASCGGLLGLFLGVSVLSIIEFFYYSTLRLYLTLRRWKNEPGTLPFKRSNVNTISLGFPNV